MAIINGYDTSGKTAADLMKHVSGGIDWSGMDVYNKISADQLISALSNGDLQKISDGYGSAKKNGYAGTLTDYQNEQMHTLFGVPYSGSGNKTMDDLNAAVKSTSSGNTQPGTDFLDQLTAIQNSGNAPSPNMQGWAENFIDKLGKAQSGSESKEDAFNRVWENYVSGNQAHATPELKAVLRQMWMGEDGGSGSNGSSAPVTNPSVYTPTYTPPVIGAGGNNYSVPNTVMGTGGVPFGSAPSGTFGDAFSQYLAAIGDSGYNKQMSGSISDLESLYKDLFGSIKTGDYTEKPYYQTIMESFGLAGDAAADDAVASSVGSNGGNLDSYAAANAKRQQLAYKTAAQGAALDAYNAEIGNLIKTLGDMGVNVNDLYATWAQNLSSERGTAADVLLGQLGVERDKYVTDAQTALDKYLGDIGLEGTKAQIEADKQMNADMLAAQKEIAQMESDIKLKIAEVERLMAQDSNASAAEIQAGINEANRLIAQYQAEAEKYGVDRNAELQMTLQTWANEMAKYGYDNEYAIAAMGAQSGGTKTAVEASSTEKQKALELARNGDVDGLNEFVDSLPEEKRESINAYVEKWKDAVTEQELSDFTRYVEQAMDHGNSYDNATAYAWTQFIAKYPRRNNEQIKHNLYERFENMYKTTY